MLEKHNWLPTANIAVLKQRAQILQQVREFFSQCGVMEVETPLLARSASTDVNLDSICCSCTSTFQEDQRFYLQTSPEFFHKRLLAAGSGAIFEISKAFRNGEAGRKHNPEFSLLEWYRPGFTYQQLMDEVQQLLGSLLSIEQFQRISFRELFLSHAGIDPFVISDQALKQAVENYVGGISLDRDECLDIILTHRIEPELKKIPALFVFDYPASQAALAKTADDEQGNSIAKRFELYVQGVELANGYQELLDAREQKSRFIEDQRQRKLKDLPVYPYDRNLLKALGHGLPECAGVAVGIDRLIMLVLQEDSIKNVMSFSFDRV